MIMQEYQPDLFDLFNELRESLTDEQIMRMIVQRLLIEMLSRHNIRLTVECLALLVDFPGYENRSMADIGRRYGLRSAAVSKRCIALAEALNITSRRLRPRKPRSPRPTFRCQ